MKFFQILFLIFLTVPIVEIYLLIKIGAVLGVLPTISLVVITAVIGAYLLRIQGFSTWLRLQQSLAQGTIPALEMVEGPILLVGGALLLTPGFFTDAVGFLCLIPQTRRRIAQHLLRKWLSPLPERRAYPEQPKTRHTIDGEYKKED